MSADASRLALSLAVEQLQAAHAAAKARLQADIDRDTARGWITDTLVPEVMVDRNGRYILLDSLTAIVAAQTVLAR